MTLFSFFRKVLTRATHQEKPNLLAGCHTNSVPAQTVPPCPQHSRATVGIEPAGHPLRLLPCSLTVPSLLSLPAHSPLPWPLDYKQALQSYRLPGQLRCYFFLLGIYHLLINHTIHLFYYSGPLQLISRAWPRAWHE